MDQWKVTKLFFLCYIPDKSGIPRSSAKTTLMLAPAKAVLTRLIRRNKLCMSSQYIVVLEADDDIVRVSFCSRKENGFLIGLALATVIVISMIRTTYSQIQLNMSQVYNKTQTFFQGNEEIDCAFLHSLFHDGICKGFNKEPILFGIHSEVQRCLQQTNIKTSNLENIYF